MSSFYFLNLDVAIMGKWENSYGTILSKFGRFEKDAAGTQPNKELFCIIYYINTCMVSNLLQKVLVSTKTISTIARSWSAVLIRLAEVLSSLPRDRSVFCA